MDTSRRPGHGPIPQWQRSEAEEVEICDRYVEGESAVQIAARLDVSADMIYKILRMRSVPRRAGGHVLIECDGQKPCLSCGELKFLHEYHRRGASRRNGRCKVCANAANRPADNARKARVREALALARAKQCPVCKRTLPGSREYFRGTLGKFGSLDAICKECIDDIARRSSRDGIDKPLTEAKITSVRLKMFIMQAYSGDDIPECACCGEREFAFLSLDHIITVVVTNIARRWDQRLATCSIASCAGKAILRAIKCCASTATALRATTAGVLIKEAHPP